MIAVNIVLGDVCVCLLRTCSVKLGPSSRIGRNQRKHMTSLAADLSAETVHVGDFMCSLAEEIHGRQGTKLKPEFVRLRKRLLSALSQNITLFWECSADVDSRWTSKGHLELLAFKSLPVHGGARLSQGLKRELANAASNARGTSIRSVRQVSVGMQVGSASGPVKRAVPDCQGQDCDEPDKKKRKSGGMPETTARNIEHHAMYNYFLALRRLVFKTPSFI